MGVIENTILFIEEFFGGEVGVQPSLDHNNPPNPDVLLPDWSTQRSAYHNTRVLCDLAGLTYSEKNLICACIFQESRFYNTAIDHNKNNHGVVLSTDWGICQVNDWYHIGSGKDFPSVKYVLDNPDKVVSWMITMYKHGMLKQWVSFSSKAYLRWLTPGSPMWSLGVDNHS